VPSATGGAEPRATERDTSRHKRICSYLQHRASQRQLQFGERDAFKPRPSKRRRQLPSPAPSVGRPHSSNNWGIPNGLLKSPLGRRLAMRHARRASEAAASAAVPTTLSPTSQANGDRKGVGLLRAGGGKNEEQEERKFVEKLPDPFEFFDKEDDPQPSKTPNLLSPKLPSSPVTPATPGTPGTPGTAALAAAVLEGLKGGGLRCEGSEGVAGEGHVELGEDIGPDPRIPHDIMRKAVTLELLGAGFKGAKGLAVDVLTDLAVEYIQCFGRQLQAAIESYTLEESTHIFELSKGDAGQGSCLGNWEPRMLADPQEGPGGIRRRGACGGSTLVKGWNPNNATSKFSRSWRRQPPPPPEPAVRNVPPFLYDNASVGSEARPAAYGEAMMGTAIGAIHGVYDGVRAALLPACLSRMGVCTSELEEHLRHLRTRDE